MTVAHSCGARASLPLVEAIADNVAYCWVSQPKKCLTKTTGQMDEDVKEFMEKAEASFRVLVMQKYFQKQQDWKGNDYDSWWLREQNPAYDNSCRYHVHDRGTSCKSTGRDGELVRYSHG